jgi:heme oxygenase
MTGERPVAALRAATAADHEAVDAAFGSLALDTREGYTAFLAAHARILPRAERQLRPGALLPGWVGRTGALHADLAALGAEPPKELDWQAPESPAGRWGAIYVIEGSRLGAAFLARSVPPELPSAYLNSKHAPGAWRASLARLDEALRQGGVAEAVVGARAMFDAFEAAARV